MPFKILMAVTRLTVIKISPIYALTNGACILYGLSFQFLPICEEWGKKTSIFYLISISLITSEVEHLS